MEFIEIGTRKIIIKGLGKVFYQDGFPLSMAISELLSKGIEVSFFHLVDELMNNGWSAKTTINKLKGELYLDIDGSMKGIDWEELESYINKGEQPYYRDKGYEEQREMKFQYLYGESSKDVINDIKNGDTGKINYYCKQIYN